MILVIIFLSPYHLLYIFHNVVVILWHLAAYYVDAVIIRASYNLTL